MTGIDWKIHTWIDKKTGVEITTATPNRVMTSQELDAMLDLCKLALKKN